MSGYRLILRAPIGSALVSVVIRWLILNGIPYIIELDGCTIGHCRIKSFGNCFIHVPTEINPDVDKFAESIRLGLEGRQQPFIPSSTVVSIN